MAIIVIIVNSISVTTVIHPIVRYYPRRRSDVQWIPVDIWLTITCRKPAVGEFHRLEEIHLMCNRCFWAFMFEKEDSTVPQYVIM